MTGIVVLIFMGLVVYGICQTVNKPAPDERPKCSVCGTTKRTLQWIKKLGGLVLLAVQRAMHPCHSEYPHRRTRMTPTSGWGEIAAGGWRRWVPAGGTLVW